MESTMEAWSPELSRVDFELPQLSFDEQDGFAGLDTGFYSTLLAMACHDLRQPLQVIVGSHDILAEGLDGLERAALARAERAATQLTKTLADLVDALRFGRLSQRSNLQAVSLGAILTALTADFADAAERNEIRLRTIRTSAVVLSHPLLLSGILRNLMRNAIAYTPRGGRVLVGCRQRGPDLHIEVSDSGVGIPANELPQIFKAFHRGNQTGSDGLGLGLFIVKRTADLLGHRIEVRSATGRGSCFALVATAASTPPAYSDLRWSDEF